MAAQVVARPSQILPLYYKTKVIHITIENGATVDILAKYEADRLMITVTL